MLASLSIISGCATAPPPPHEVVDARCPPPPPPIYSNNCVLKKDVIDVAERMLNENEAAELKLASLEKSVVSLEEEVARALKASLGTVESEKASVAIVGALERARWASQIFGNLRQNGYGGKIHLVNPRQETVYGERCFPSLRDIGEPVDHAMVIVPAANVAEVAVEHGVPTVVEFFGLDQARTLVQEHGRADLLVAEAHPHRRPGLDVAGVGQAALVRDRSRQADLGEHVEGVFVAGMAERPVPLGIGDDEAAPLRHAGHPEQRGAAAGLPADFSNELFDVLIAATCRMEDEIIAALQRAARDEAETA